MKNKEIQKITTKDGFMVPVYKDWDVETNEGYKPAMVYATYLNPGVEKDIIVHKQRTGYLACLFGAVRVEAYVNGQLEEHLLSFNDAKDKLDLLMVDPGTPLKFTNQLNQVSIILNCPSPAWHPDNEDTYKFTTWEEYLKWLD